MSLKNKMKDIWKKVSDLEGGEEKAESLAKGKDRIPYKTIAQKLKEVMKQNVDVIGRKIIIPSYYVLYFNESDRQSRVEVEEVMCEELKEELYHEMRKINPEQNKGELVILMRTDASLPGGQFRIEPHIKLTDGAAEPPPPEIAVDIASAPTQQMDLQKTLVEQPLSREEEEPKTVVQKRPQTVLYKLLVDSGQEVQEYAIVKETITIGRGSRDDIVLQSPDFTISRSHATITYANGVYTLLPQGVNGTFLNDRELELNKPAVIVPGDEIRIINYRLKITQ